MIQHFGRQAQLGDTHASTDLPSTRTHSKEAQHGRPKRCRQPPSNPAPSGGGGLAWLSCSPRLMAEAEAESSRRTSGIELSVFKPLIPADGEGQHG